MVNWNKRGLKKLKFWKIILWGSQWGRLIGHNLTPFGLPDLPLLTLTSLNLNVDKNRHSCTRFPYIFVHVVLKKTQGKLKLFLCENHNQTKEKWIEYYDCKILKCINFWYKILVLGGLFLLTLKMFGGIKNVNPNVKVIHFFASKENQINFACQHCSLRFFLQLSRRHTDHCSF